MNDKEQVQIFNNVGRFIEPQIDFNADIYEPELTI